MVTHYRESPIVAFQPTVADGPSVENRDLFYYYMAERYNIWRRRFLKKKPPPWTKDPILANYQFTNVFRHLDRNSQWLYRSISEDREAGKKVSKQEIAWRVILFRLINRIETFEDLGGMPFRKKFDITKFCKRLRELKESDGGRSVFTSAYITCQCSNKRDRIGNFEEMMGGICERWPEVWAVIGGATSFKEAYTGLKRFYGLGQFNAYDLSIDLCVLDIFPNEWRDSFAHAGPGCRVGIDGIWPYGTIDYTEAMEILRDNQDKYFKHACKVYGIKWRGPRLMLHDIEFNLCEVSKYYKMKLKVGKQRMKFSPRTANNVWIYQPKTAAK